METPFDNLLTSLWQQMTNNLHRNNQHSELFSSVYAFSRLARTLYLNMAEASQKMQLQHEADRKQPGTRTLTLEEMREKDDFSIRCRLSYIQFIEEVNRIGRVLRTSGHSPPLYSRVYFFRNKMVEHWDDYLQFLSEGEGFGYSTGKIVIPYDFAGITQPDSGRHGLQQELTIAFAQSGVTLPALEGKWYAEYSGIMYAALEQIDSDLRRIPEPLVILLFKYCFPTPICDMEAYCTELAAWLGALPLR